MKATTTALLVGLLLPIAAVAQEWTTYTYADPGFTIQFPGVPEVQTGTVKNTTGVSLPMTRYAVRQDRVTFSLSVVNYSSTNADALTTILETERTLGASGKVTGAAGARIKRAFGRQLSVNGNDGSRSAIAIFFVNKHLYTLVAQALPPDPMEASGDAIRFQQSLRFLDDDGGFFGFFGGGTTDIGGRSGSGSGSGDGAASAGASAGVSASAGSSGAVTGGTRSRGATNAPADAACAGKSAGDAVQLETPSGPVPATCTLVARPNVPPKGRPVGPPGAQN